MPSGIKYISVLILISFILILYHSFKFLPFDHRLARFYLLSLLFELSPKLESANLQHNHWDLLWKILEIFDRVHEKEAPSWSSSCLLYSNKAAINRLILIKYFFCGINLLIKLLLHHLVHIFSPLPIKCYHESSLCYVLTFTMELDSQSRGKICASGQEPLANVYLFQHSRFSMSLQLLEPTSRWNGVRFSCHYYLGEMSAGK